jgi:hypothetical protein
MTTEEAKEEAQRRNKLMAKNYLLELLKACPQVIPPSIGIEAYLNLLDEGAELLLKRGDIVGYPVN